MASIITGILSSAVDLLLNKVRDISADKLKDGDITEAKLREIVVRELTNVNFKLGALSRRDLLSSYCFLQEGVDKLNTFLGKQNDEEKAVLNEASKDIGAEPSRMGSGAEFGMLNEASKLCHAMEKLKISPDQEFESAIKRFEEARKKATEAFCNEALSIQDRILAAKFKVVSEILECLATPETAISGCLSFLNKLHSLPAVREIFSVYLNRGVMSMLNKAERVENVKSVMFINFVLYQFVFKFSRNPTSLLAWPTIELADRSFNPIRDWCEVSTRKSWGGELIQPLNVLILSVEIEPHRSTVNNRGETVAVCTYRTFGRDGRDIKVISSTGESRWIDIPKPKEAKVTMDPTLGLASDSNNNVYVLKGFEIWTKTDGVTHRCVLFVLDENYNVKHDCVLHFIRYEDFYAMAINKNNDVIMARDGTRFVYVCDNTGQLKYWLDLADSFQPNIPSLSISNQNEIMIPSRDDKVVQIYTDEGKLKSTIPVPKGHEIRGLAFHYVISKLFVLTKENESYHILYYSETGKLELSIFLGKDYFSSPFMTSHPSGVIAIIESRRITFL